MNLLVHTGTRNGTTTPLLRTVETSVSINPLTGEGIAANIRDFHNPLTKETEVKGGYEKAFKICLLERGLKVDYEPFSFFVARESGRDITYTPDFVTDLKVSGRQVIIEPHGMRFGQTGRLDLLERKMRRLRQFRSVSNGKFYLIVASDLSLEGLGLRMISSPKGAADEWWETPNAHFDRSNVENIRQRLRELCIRANR